MKTYQIPEDTLKAILTMAFKKGFEASGEGFNGEYCSLPGNQHPFEYLQADIQAMIKDFLREEYWTCD